VLVAAHENAATQQRAQPGFGNEESNSAARWRNLRPDVGMADRNGRIGRASGPACGATMRFRGVPAGPGFRTARQRLDCVRLSAAFPSRAIPAKPKRRSTGRNPNASRPRTVRPRDSPPWTAPTAAKHRNLRVVAPGLDQGKMVRTGVDRKAIVDGQYGWREHAASPMVAGQTQGIAVHKTSFPFPSSDPQRLAGARVPGVAPVRTRVQDDVAVDVRPR